jgi:glycosyltransferase involved in cell wall biosynthesis
MQGESIQVKRQDRVDILLATYNGERFIACQLESILSQMDDGCRLLIRDDGSSDGTLAVVRRFVAERPDRIVLLDQGTPRLGACGSFGRLLEFSDADYVVLCDQDDVWLPGRIAKPLTRIKELERDLGVNTPVLAHTDLVVVDENLNTIAPSFWSYSNLDPHRGSRLNRLLIQNVVTGCATVINRALAQRASPIPASTPMHDWWLALVAAAFGRIEAIPEKTVLYRQHSGNRLGAIRYDWHYVLRRARQMLGGGAAAQRLRQTQEQAMALLRFAHCLQPQHRDAITALVNINKAGFIERRVLLLRHGFLGTGHLRNLSWLMLI